MPMPSRHLQRAVIRASEGAIVEFSKACVPTNSLVKSQKLTVPPRRHGSAMGKLPHATSTQQEASLAVKSE